MKSGQCHPQSYAQSPSKKESKRVGTRRTLILAQSHGIDGLAWLDWLESRSSIIIWHPLNIVPKKERGKTHEDNLFHIAPLPMQQQPYRQD